jgi:hypothetical protein
MEQTSRSRRIILLLTGVFMTASEANRQRVSKLVLVEREQMWGQFTTVDKKSPAVKRGKPPMSETRQLWISNSLSFPPSPRVSITNSLLPVRQHIPCDLNRQLWDTSRDT